MAPESPAYWSGGTRRIAKLLASDHRESNSLWPRIEDLYEAYLSPTDLPRADKDSMRDLYTHRRHTTFDSAATTRVWTSLERDVQHTLQSILGSPTYLEAELIHALSDASPHNVVCLIGNPGVGKSTLLHFALRIVAPSTPSLSHLWPIIVDARTESRTESRDSWVFWQVLRAAEISLRTANGSHLPTASTMSADPKALRATAEAIGLPFDVYDVIKREDAASEAAAIAIECMQRYAQRHDRRLVVALDNVDQISSHGVVTLSSLARKVAITHQIRCILMLRPRTRWTLLERNENVGFLRRFITVSPPDLKDVLLRQAKSADDIESVSERLSQLMITTSGGSFVPVSSMAQLVDAIFDLYLPETTRNTLLANLCNYDVRKATIAFRTIVRHRDLDIPLLAQRALVRNVVDNERVILYPSTRSGSDAALIKSLMVDNWDYYTEDRAHGPSVIMNLFSNSISDLHGIKHGLLYRLLQIINYLGYVSSISQLYDIAEQCDVPIGSIPKAVRKLINFGLISSDQTDADSDANPMELRITETGLYYLETLASNEEYLFHVVFDTPLSHGLWVNGYADRPHGELHMRQRLDAMLELWNRVISEDRDLVNLLFTGQGSVAAAEAAVTGQLLSQHIKTAVSKNINNLKRSSSRVVIESVQSVSHLVQGLSRDTEGIVDEFASARSRIERRSGRYNRRSAVELEGDGKFQVFWPALSEPGDEGVIRYSLDVPHALRHKTIQCVKELSGLAPTTNRAFIKFEPASGQSRREVREVVKRTDDQLGGTIWLNVDGQLVGEVQISDADPTV